ncbi:MAG: hypothetical protein Q7S87_04720 [Agitococcus sp.]|nr:hypothetical protein [Agitococcus sp.]
MQTLDQPQDTTAATETAIPAWGSFGAGSTIEGAAELEGDDTATTASTVEAKTETGAETAVTTPVVDTGSEIAQPKADEAKTTETTTTEKRLDPLLVATAPADADAQLAEITTQKLDLASKFDDGDLTSREYMEQLDALNKQERKIEGEVQKAQIAFEMAAQQERNAFLSEVNKFTADTPYAKSKYAWEMLDTEVRKVASSPENTNLSGREILEKAHAEVLKDPVMALAFSQQQQQPAKQPDKPAQPSAPAKKPNAPITLAHVPAAEISEAGEGRFAVIDRIQDPDERSQVIAKMTSNDRQAYLSGAS